MMIKPSGANLQKQTKNHDIPPLGERKGGGGGKEKHHSKYIQLEADREMGLNEKHFHSSIKPMNHDPKQKPEAGGSASVGCSGMEGRTAIVWSIVHKHWQLLYIAATELHPQGGSLLPALDREGQRRALPGHEGGMQRAGEVSMLGSALSPHPQGLGSSTQTHTSTNPQKSKLFHYSICY